MGIFTLKDVQFIAENFPPSLAAAVLLLLLTVAVTLKVNELIKAPKAADEKRDKELEELKKQVEKEQKQRHKLEQLISSAPCISKNNGLWLQAEDRNGGQPPEPIKCLYQEAKGQVGK